MMCTRERGQLWWHDIIDAQGTKPAPSCKAKKTVPWTDFELYFGHGKKPRPPKRERGRPAGPTPIAEAEGEKSDVESDEPTDSIDKSCEQTKHGEDSIAWLRLLLFWLCIILLLRCH